MRKTTSNETEQIKEQIKYLKRELRNKRHGLPSLDLGKHYKTHEELWHSKLNLTELYRKSSYFKTLLAMIKSSFLYDFFIRSMYFFRKFRLISYVALAISYVLTLVGTGAILLVYLSFFALVLFFSLFFLLNFIIIASTRRKKANMFFEKNLDAEQICIFHITRQQSFTAGSFFEGCVKELAKNGCAVLIVTPKIYGRTGFDGKKRRGFITFRKEAEGIYLLRSHYYFSFKKTILPKINAKTALIF